MCGIIPIGVLRINSSCLYFWGGYDERTKVRRIVKIIAHTPDKPFIDNDYLHVG